MELPDPFPPLTKAGGEVVRWKHAASQQVVEPSAGSLLTFLALEELSAAGTLRMQAWGCLMTALG